MKIPAIAFGAFMIVSFLSCDDATDTAKNTTGNSVASAVMPPVADAAGAPAVVTPPKRFTSVSEMIEDLDDYAEDNGTFKIISKSPLHIQISNQHGEGTDEEAIKKGSKASVVYVAYQVFASTDLEEITITSAPLLIDIDASKIKGIIEPARYTAKINRERAQQVMQQQVGVTNFEDLLGVDSGNGFYFANSPNRKFEELKGEGKVEEVFKALQQ